MTEYKAIAAISGKTKGISELVNEALGQGYKLIGGVAVSLNKDGDLILVQAMAREIQKPKVPVKDRHAVIPEVFDLTDQAKAEVNKTSPEDVRKIVAGLDD